MEYSTYCLFSAEPILFSSRPVPILVVLIGCAMIDLPTSLLVCVPTAARGNGGEVDAVVTAVTAVDSTQGCPLRVGGIGVFGRGGICDSIYMMEFKIVVKLRS